MTTDNSLQIREQLNSRLNGLVQSTENIYLQLGRDYPLLLQELEKSVINSSDAVSSLRKDGSLSSIDHIISEGASLTDQFNKSFTEMYSRDGELFEIIQNGIAGMGKLSEIISNIKEISIEMELISLNAMTVALKSGTAGKAFSFITDELKKLSAQTIKLTDELTHNGNKQLDSFENFRTMIESAREVQNNLSQNLSEIMLKGFSDSSLNLKNSAQTMDSLSNSSKGIQPLLVRIMQEIQLQDIIRQSIDHIFLSLEGIEAINAQMTVEEKKDELTFRHMIPDLCQTVLDDVKNEISESSRVFDDQSEQVRNILDSLEEERRNFSGEDNSISEVSTEKISKLLKSVQESIKGSLEISETGINLLKEITVLQRQFLSFEPIVTRFHNIIVASRIEVAKQSALSDMRDTVTKMTDLTDDINRDITEALETIKIFLKTTEKTIANYSNMIHMETPELKALITRTGENQTRLGDINEVIARCLRSFVLFTPRFYELFETTDKNRMNLKELVNSIDSIEILFHSIKEDSQKELKQYVDEGQEINWSIQNERLKSIIENFTIFTHKKSASDLTGATVEAEETADSGEVTLF